MRSTQKNSEKNRHPTKAAKQRRRAATTTTTTTTNHPKQDI